MIIHHYIKASINLIQGRTMKLKQLSIYLLFVTFCTHAFAMTNAPSVPNKILQQVSQIMTDNKFKKEEERLQQIISTSPSKNAFVSLGNLYISENKNKEAIKNYQQATLIDPTDPKLFTAMSIAYLHLGFYEMSKAMAEQATELDPALIHAGKIIKYINKKQEVLDKAAKVDKKTK